MNLAWYLLAVTIMLAAGLAAGWIMWGPRCRAARHDQFVHESELDGERATCLICGRSTVMPSTANANYWAGFHDAAGGRDEFVADAVQTPLRSRGRGSATSRSSQPE